MRKVSVIVCLLMLASASLATAQDGPKLGMGVFGGLNFPVLQGDQGNGSEFGFKGRWGLGSLIVLEPYVAFVKWGEPDPLDDGTKLGIDGSKVTSFGLEAALGNYPGKLGLNPYFVAGVGSYKVKNDDTGFDESSFGWSAGLGLGFGLSPMLALDVKGKLMVAPQDGGGSKKGISAVVGVNYTFGASE